MRVGPSLVTIIVGFLLACVIAGAQVGGGSLTFYREVLPILRGHCETCRRAGGIAPVSFGSYEEMMIGFFDVAVVAGLDKRGYFLRN